MASNIGSSDAKLVLQEIGDILQLASGDPVEIVNTIRKLEKVVKAVPRMESFITNISRRISEDPQQQVSIEQMIPRVAYLRSIENDYRTLLSGLTHLLSIPDT